MRHIRGADHHQPLDALRVALAEGQRDHPAIGGTDNGAQLLDAQVIEQAQRRIGLVVAGDAGEGVSPSGPVLASLPPM